MSLQVGLGACQEDLEVQGEIDFDFFEGERNVKPIDGVRSALPSEYTVSDSSQPIENESSRDEIPTVVTTVLPESLEAKSKIVCLETTIPSPEDYHCNGSCTGDYDNHMRRDFGFASGTQNVPKENEDFLLSPLSSNSTSASDASSSSSLTLSDEDDSFEEETDSMTDVSPLPMTPGKDRSPSDSYKVEETLSSNICHTNQDGVSASAKTENRELHTQKPMKVNQLMKAMKQLEIDQNAVKRKPKIHESIPFLTVANKHKKNPSFTNEEVRRIDHDNQRLLKKILAQQNRAKPTFTPSHHVRPSSAVNRHRQQRQIELENMALLQRLEAAKPSKDLSRSHLLNDYKRRPSLPGSSRSSTRPVSSSMSMSCRNSAYTSGRTSTLTVPLCSKTSKQK